MKEMAITKLRQILDDDELSSSNVSISYGEICEIKKVFFENEKDRLNGKYYKSELLYSTRSPKDPKFHVCSTLINAIWDIERAEEKLKEVL